jgi:hypothetical protein
VTQFIIHVGPHKTGTTYLQEAFVQARPQLAGRGIHYPTTWGPSAHHALYERLRAFPNPKLEAEFAALHAARHPTVLISVEGLAGLPEPAVAYLRGLIGPDNRVTVVYYVRTWADLLPSHWKESIKVGETDTLPEYLYRQLQNPAGSSYINFAVGLRIWAGQFGADAIRLTAYNLVIDAKRDLFQHFAQQFLGWRDAPAPALPPANVSPGVADIEVIRAVSALEQMQAGPALPRTYVPALAACYLRRRAELVTPEFGKALADHTTRIPINESGPALIALHRALMAEFKEALVPPRLPNFFFRPRRAEVPYVHPNWLLAPGVAGQLKAIQEAVRIEVEASRRRGNKNAVDS